MEDILDNDNELKWDLKNFSGETIQVGGKTFKVEDIKRIFPSVRRAYFVLNEECGVYTPGPKEINKDFVAGLL